MFLAEIWFLCYLEGLFDLPDNTKTAIEQGKKVSIQFRIGDCSKEEPLSVPKKRNSYFFLNFLYFL